MILQLTKIYEENYFSNLPPFPLTSFNSQYARQCVGPTLTSDIPHRPTCCYRVAWPMAFGEVANGYNQMYFLYSPGEQTCAAFASGLFQIPRGVLTLRGIIAFFAEYSTFVSTVMLRLAAFNVALLLGLTVYWYPRVPPQR